MRILTLFLLTFASFAYAQTLYRLPEDVVTVSMGVVNLNHRGRILDYIDGMGWVQASISELPVLLGNRVYVSPAVLDFLGILSPRIEAVRVSYGETLRIVLDISDPHNQGLGGGLVLEQEGQVEAERALQLNLPQILPPLNVPMLATGVSLEFVDLFDGTGLRLRAPGANYRFFSLSEPERLVLDLTGAAVAGLRPAAPAAPAASPAPSPVAARPATPVSPAPAPTSGPQTLRPGVVYRRFNAPSAAGTSGVHLLEIAPDAGHFRVVGQSRVARPLSELASGAFAAINASYFDTRNNQTIGLLKVDSALLSPPSRNRASIGFGLGKPVIERVYVRNSAEINGVYYNASDPQLEGRIVVHGGAGYNAGRGDRGAIIVQNGRVIGNMVGPRVVPPNGFVIEYDPTIRELALLDEGAPVRVDYGFSPDIFERVPYAVEAGPLLVYNGQSAFEPTLEQFAVGQRILDDRTQQAAIGVKPDGTVLLVAADSMTARDLIPLFISLGADSAMRLDSGGSTTIYAGGRVLNREPSTQRRIVSAIVFIPN